VLLTVRDGKGGENSKHQVIIVDSANKTPVARLASNDVTCYAERRPF
jgi:hypothetical protein